MIDLVNINIIAGDGGNGAVSFYKLKNMRYGKPDGGDGGNGGSVFIEADPLLFDLEPYRGVNTCRAESGGNGGHNQKRGKDGGDTVIKVPTGTVVKLKMAADGSSPVMIFDLKEPGQKILAARGGDGGRGNTHARGVRDRKGKRPNHWDMFNRAQKGRIGETVQAVMELKYLAQVGLIGLPNAGKSSLLSVLTHAKPKIADYPFTTLIPNIGVLEASGKTPASSSLTRLRGASKIEKIVIADIPGLIEGASLGRGLGDKFLKHIERTGLLVHVLDGTGADVKKNYETVRSELKYYGQGLDKKKEIIAINKLDLMNKKQIESVKKLFARKKKNLVSAQNGEGVDTLKKLIINGIQ